MAEKKEYFAYGSILEALSSGLYPDKKHVLREFLQNSFDAVLDWKKISNELSPIPIEINLRKPSIFISDHGTGMDKADAQKFRYIGYSTKDRLENAGFRGIGKDSGLSIAETIIVTTSKYGTDKKYQIIINAEKMLKESAKNIPLEELIESNTSIVEEPETKESHYTFIELYKIKKDSEILFNTQVLDTYLRRVCPVQFDPDFEYADEISNKLKKHIPSFSDVEILLDGSKLFKPFPQDCIQPEYELIFTNDEENAPVLAYCWYCGHAQKGHFPEKNISGMVYHVKNFAIGDGQLTRRTLWNATPERAFHFFGEIHVLDKGVIPSSDRLDFIDNDARENLYKRCGRIAQILNQTAGTESEQRRFDEAISNAGSLINTRKDELENAKLPVEMKNEVEFQIREVLKDIEKRTNRTKGKRKKSVKDLENIKRADSLVPVGKKLLNKIDSGNEFVDIKRKLDLNDQAQKVYQIILDCLKEEFSYDIKKLEKIINKINEALEGLFVNLPR